ncbi:MAG TPA: hypothetical protein VF581_04550 [Flavobacterium sp.]|jgi:hypothetical protein
MNLVRPFQCKLKNIQRLLLLLFAVSALQSCQVTLVASQDVQLIEQIDAVSKEIDSFYLHMLEMAPVAYSVYADRYIEIEVALNSIYDRSRLKPKNTETARIAKNVRDTWAKYKSEHKTAGQLTAGVITYNHATMDDFLFALSVAENAKPK